MVCTGTYVHSGDVITIGQALPTLRGPETGCVLKGPSGEMMVLKLSNPSEISQEALFGLARKRLNKKRASIWFHIHVSI